MVCIAINKLLFKGKLSSSLFYLLTSKLNGINIKLVGIDTITAITRRLTDKQSKFLEAYKTTGKAVESAISAGYSVRSAPVEANRLLKHPTILLDLDNWRKEKQRNLSKSDFVDIAMNSFNSLEITEPNSPRFLDIAGKALGHIGANDKAINTTNNVQINIDARQLPSNDKWNLLRNALEND